MSLFNNFNNRELALIFWLSVFLVWLVFRRDTRKSIFQVIKIFLDKRILIPLVAMTAYISMVIFLLSEIGVWSLEFIKDTVFWYFGSAFVLFMTLDKILKGEPYFKKILRDTFALIVIFTFIVNLYPFPLIVEIIIAPILFMVVAMQVVAERDEKNKKVKQILDFLPSVFGISLLIYAFSNLTNNFQNFTTTKNFIAFSLPILLTYSLLPFLYIFGLIMTYDSLFRSIDNFLKRDRSLARYFKRKLLILFNFNVGELSRFYREHSKDISSLRDRNDVNMLVNQFERRHSIHWSFVVRWVVLASIALVILWFAVTIFGFLELLTLLFTQLENIFLGIAAFFAWSAYKQTQAISDAQQQQTQNIHQEQLRLADKQAFIALFEHLKELREIDEKNAHFAILTANQLELIAVAWKQKVTDKVLLFDVYGTAFVRLFENIKDANFPEGSRSGNEILSECPYAIELYEIWKPAVEKRRIENAQ